MAFVPNASCQIGAIYSDLVLNALFRGVFGTPPATVYVGYAKGASIDALTEFAGVRGAVRCNRGTVRGSTPTRTVNKTTFPLTSNYFELGEPITVFIDRADAGGDVTGIMVYDAASAGNLLLKAYGTTGRAVIGGDVLTVPTTALSIYGGSGETVTANVVDWLFRGLAINGDLSVAAYPNVYLTLSGLAAAFPNAVTMARAAGTWAAPSYINVAASEARKVSNAAAVTFGPAVQAGSASVLNVRGHLNTPATDTMQVFDGTVTKASGSWSWGVGDFISFPAGTLDMVYG